MDFLQYIWGLYYMDLCTKCYSDICRTWEILELEVQFPLVMMRTPVRCLVQRPGQEGAKMLLMLVRLPPEAEDEGEGEAEAGLLPT